MQFNVSLVKVTISIFRPDIYIATSKVGKNNKIELQYIILLLDIIGKDEHITSETGFEHVIV